MDFLKDIRDGLKNEYASIAYDGVSGGDFTGYLDTGSYSLNGLLSGTIYGGIANSKITAFAGPSSYGKTFFVLGAAKNFLDEDPDSVIVFFESESAISKDMLIDRGIDTKRFLIIPVATVEEFRFQSLKIISNFEKMKKKDRKPMVIMLDSMGMLSTNKEVEDTESGSTTKDMTRTQLIKGLFRVLTLRLGKIDVPLVFTNHTYMEIGMFPKQVMGGGTGPRYAASTIVYLGKRKEMDKKTNTVVGNIITCTLSKARLTKENSKAEVLLTYKNGLDRYYGLVDFATEAGIWKKSGNYVVVNDTKYYAKAIYKTPEKFFTKEVLDAIDIYVGKKYKYGSASDDEDEDFETNMENDDDSESSKDTNLSS